MKKICSWLLVLAMLVTWFRRGAGCWDRNRRNRADTPGSARRKEPVRTGSAGPCGSDIEQPQLQEDQIADIIVLLMTAA